MPEKDCSVMKKKKYKKILGRFFFCFLYCRARAVVRCRSYRLMMLHVYNEFPRRRIFNNKLRVPERRRMGE
jgi:hypothetical protein